MAQYGLRHARAENSKNRLTELSNRLTKLRELEPFHGLTIFAAGSYGRLEASKHSDLDLFFFLTGDGNEVEDLRRCGLIPLAERRASPGWPFTHRTGS